MEAASAGPAGERVQQEFGWVIKFIFAVPLSLGNQFGEGGVNTRNSLPNTALKTLVRVGPLPGHPPPPP